MRNYLKEFVDGPVYAGTIVTSTWLLAIVSFSLAMLAQATTGLSAIMANTAARLGKRGESVAILHASGHDVAMFAVGIVLPNASSAEKWAESSLAKDQVDQSILVTAVEKAPACSEEKGDIESEPTAPTDLLVDDALGTHKQP